jgi:hypothetical protein
VFRCSHHLQEGGCLKGAAMRIISGYGFIGGEIIDLVRLSIHFPVFCLCVYALNLPWLAAFVLKTPDQQEKVNDHSWS